ncbi:multisubunit sodium/proton antiporter MrpF subunit [Tepidamorphus gemmatus]|jgi:multicomponent Na+:H+ antiporter subunit F|uniref:Multisubunit sodium/proton antiporter MrpF subunit n=1 Tax=Tepidamorphus gemmatus TaxID=747076 RepID=A0A4R3LVQ3_9HYPH|nr:monovalent cation/H+ antiporter complex subunit F [Tepidamorphus gemmatus]TCT04146.1 multisubunit sodium/proton antiporter MrpF subunit [Tepidamorphus gemmatus]
MITVMFAVAMVAVLVTLALAVVRALVGPTVFDRLVAANAIGNAAILLVAVYGFLTERPQFLDMGILYALLNIVGTIAVLKYFRFGDLSHPGGEEPTK